jgi:hypothetical protein
MFEVAIHGYGKPIVRRGAAEGLPDFPKHTWTRITPRPIGRGRAVNLAADHPFHAVVTVWQSSETVYDNGKAPYLPDGWVSAS